MTVRLLHGDCRQVLKTLPETSVHCVVTSPPYYGLRDYGTATWAAGDPACDHVIGEIRTGLGLAKLGERYAGGGHKASEPKPMTAKNLCPRCGAVRVDQQIGLEETPAAYVAEMVAVFREVWRVLRDDGVCWLNLGDSYAGSWGNQGRKPERGTQRPINGPMIQPVFDGRYGEQQSNTGKVPFGLKQKDLMLIPARVALALQEDGWFLRSDVIWHKPNPMPESCTDRPTSSHEHVFLLTKKATYFYDADAVREGAVGLEPGDMDGGAQRLPDGSNANAGRNYRRQDSPQSIKSPHGQGFTRRAKGNAKTFRGGGAYTQSQAFDNSAVVARDSVGNEPNETFTRNLRNVWTIATTPYGQAHFATFPPALVETCIKAGTSEKGCCAACGAPWKRVVTKGKPDEAHRAASGADSTGGYSGHSTKDHEAHGVQDASDVKRRILEGMRERISIWVPACKCAAASVPCTVLDPFVGSGTTAMVADRLGRHAIGIDLNQGYGEMAKNRVTDDCPLFAEFVP